MKIDPNTLPVLSDEIVNVCNENHADYEYMRINMADLTPEEYTIPHRITTPFHFMTDGDYNAMMDGKDDYGHIAPAGSIVYWDSSLERIYTIVVIKNGRRYVYDLSGT